MNTESVVPMFDPESEKDQQFTDRVNQIYSSSLNPQNITPDVIREAVDWAWRNNRLGELSDNVMGDDAYNGALLGGIVRDYLFVCAEKEAEK